jgi:hypothetical protein
MYSYFLYCLFLVTNRALPHAQIAMFYDNLLSVFLLLLLSVSCYTFVKFFLFIKNDCLRDHKNSWRHCSYMMYTYVNKYDFDFDFDFTNKTAPHTQITMFYGWTKLFIVHYSLFSVQCSDLWSVTRVIFFIAERCCFHSLASVRPSSMPRPIYQPLPNTRHRRTSHRTNPATHFD